MALALMSAKIFPLWQPGALWGSVNGAGCPGRQRASQQRRLNNKCQPGNGNLETHKDANTSRLRIEEQTGRGSPATMDNHSLRSRASEATLVSLLELDPTPMDSPNIDKDLPPLPGQTDEKLSDSTGSVKSPTTSAGLGLSGSGHGAIYYRTSPPTPNLPDHRSGQPD
jgi:hypothetical protein